MRVTIKDIAKDLRMSKTASLFVVSGNSPLMGISAANTQKRIQQHVKKEEYQFKLRNLFV